MLSVTLSPFRGWRQPSVRALAVLSQPGGGSPILTHGRRFLHFHEIWVIQIQIPPLCSLYNMHTRHTYLPVGWSNCRITHKQHYYWKNVSAFLAISLNTHYSYFLTVYTFFKMSTLESVFQFQRMSCALTCSSHASECRDKTPRMPRCLR